jgi:hypothetical protein
MAISKRVSNTGATSNHGMTEIDVANELAKQERDLRNEHRGHVCGCGNGCKYTLSKSHTPRQAAQLEIFLEGQCPQCTDWKNPKVNAMSNYLAEYTFDVNGQELTCLRYPLGYRPKKIVKVEAEPTE